MTPRPWRSLGVVLVVAVVVGGIGTLVGADSPYEENADVEGIPDSPDRPPRLDQSSVERYVVATERRLLYNDLLTSRGHSLDANDRVIRECRSTSVTETGPDEFRVRLRCEGGIDDSLRLLEPGPFSYAVTYRITDNETRQVALRNYPFDPERGFNDCRGELACSASTGG